MRLSKPLKQWSKRSVIVFIVVGVALLCLGGGAVKALFFGGTTTTMASSSVELQKGLIGNWQFNGNATDSTPYGNNGTVTSATLTTDREGKASSAYSFNGTNAKIANTSTAGPLSTFANSGAKTYSVWFNTSTLTGTHDMIVITNGPGNQVGDQLRLNGSSLQVSRFGLGTFINTASTSITTGTWHLATYTWDGTNAKLYLDGVFQNSTTNAPASGTANQLNIGSYGSGEYWSGSLDSVRIYNRALSQTEVTALAKQYDVNTKVAQGENNLLGWWPFDGSAKDATPYADNGTVTNVTLAADRESKASSAYSFNGTNTKITLGNSATLDPETLSVSLWLKTTQSGSFVTLLERLVPTAGSAYPYALGMTTTGTISFSCYDGTNTPGVTSTTTVNDGSWHHIVVTRVKQGAIKLYIDGALKNTGTDTTTASTTNSNTVYAGARSDNTHWFNGSIDDVRLYGRALSQSDVSNLYKTYNSSIKLGTVSNNINLSSGLIGYWPLNGNLKDLTPYQSNGTNNGATLTADRLGRANSAYSFDGLTNNMTFPYGKQFDSGSMTVSFWLTVNTNIDCDSNNNYRILIRKSPTVSGTTTGWDVVLEQNMGVQFDVGYGGTSHRSGTISVGMAVGTPIFLTFTYDASTGTRSIYANAVQKNTVTLGAAAIAPSSSPLGLSTGINTGSCPTSAGYVPGVYDDVHLWNRALSAAEITAAYNEYR